MSIRFFLGIRNSPIKFEIPFTSNHKERTWKKEIHTNKINGVMPFHRDEDIEITGILGLPWLLMHEGSRLSMNSKIALSLAD